MNSFLEIFEQQKDYFAKGNTIPLKFRKNYLSLLQKWILHHQNDIITAIQLDMHKSETEIVLSEIMNVKAELRLAINNIALWAKKNRVKTPLTLWPSKSYIQFIPKGVVLIISPWNYPFLLLMSPLISAIAAGNCVILKPSEFTSNTNAVISRICNEVFPPSLVSIIEGEGKVIVPDLISNIDFDHIFFTGSTAVGKKISILAAQNFIPITCELGGKNPAIIAQDANLEASVQKLLWGKLFNAGQTCISPDFVAVHQSFKATFESTCIKAIDKFLSKNNLASKHFSSIKDINKLNRLQKLIKDTTIIFGGSADLENLKIDLTLCIIDDVEHPLLQEEIFGPILPIIYWQNKEDLIQILHKNKHPLTLYLFSSSKQLKEYLEQNFSSGSLVMNQTLVYHNNPHLPFGGLKTSGLGFSHGKFGFQEFSQLKSYFIAPSWFVPKYLFPPYSKHLLRIFKKI